VNLSAVFDHRLRHLIHDSPMMETAGAALLLAVLRGSDERAAQYPLVRRLAVFGRAASAESSPQRHACSRHFETLRTVAPAHPRSAATARSAPSWISAGPGN
jgi:hypothetical protein